MPAATTVPIENNPPQASDGVRRAGEPFEIGP